MVANISSGGNHFQFGHNWEVNLPVKVGEGAFLILYSIFLGVLSFLELSTEQTRAKQRENIQAEGRGSRLVI